MDCSPACNLCLTSGLGWRNRRDFFLVIRPTVPSVGHKTQRELRKRVLNEEEKKEGNRKGMEGWADE